MDFVGLVSELKVILYIVEIVLHFERDNLACFRAQIEHFLRGHGLGRLNLNLVEHGWCFFLLINRLETLDLKSFRGGGCRSDWLNIFVHLNNLCFLSNCAFSI